MGSGTKHTPEPWFLDFDSGDQVAILSRCKEHPLIATISKGRGRPHGDANAALLLASPRLLAACEGLLAVVERVIRPDERDLAPEIVAARSAIEKAVVTP